MAVSAAQQSSNRGVQNVRVERRPTNDIERGKRLRPATDNTHVKRRSTQSDLEGKLLQGQVRRRQQAIEAKEAKDYEREEKRKAQFGVFGSVEQNAPSAPKSTNALGVGKKLARHSKWLTTGFASVIYSLQLGLAIPSAIAFGIFIAYQEAIQSLGLLGSAIEAVISALTSTANTVSNLVIGTDIIPSMNAIAFIVWFATTFVVLVGFCGLWIWYRCIGIRPFGSIGSFLATTFFIIVSCVPISNLFPWIIGWTMFINTSSLFLRK